MAWPFLLDARDFMHLELGSPNLALEFRLRCLVRRKAASREVECKIENQVRHIYVNDAINSRTPPNSTEMFRRNGCKELNK